MAFTEPSSVHGAQPLYIYHMTTKFNVTLGHYENEALLFCVGAVLFSMKSTQENEAKSVAGKIWLLLHV